MIDLTQIVRASVTFLVLASSVAFWADGMLGAASVIAGGVVVLAQLESSKRRVRKLINAEMGRLPFVSPALLFVAVALYCMVPVVHVAWLAVGLSGVVVSIAVLGIRQASLALPMEAS
jgi:hypothetical protein